VAGGTNTRVSISLTSDAPLVATVNSRNPRHITLLMSALISPLSTHRSSQILRPCPRDQETLPLFAKKTAVVDVLNCLPNPISTQIIMPPGSVRSSVNSGSISSIRMAYIWLRWAFVVRNEVPGIDLMHLFTSQSPVSSSQTKLVL
jgi:hypothetical protein